MSEPRSLEERRRSGTIWLVVLGLMFAPLALSLLAVVVWAVSGLISLAL